MRSLEGANCADLPAFVVDKYFSCNVGKQPLLAMAAKAICGNCVVREDCLSEALSLPNLQPGGVIGGVAATEVHAARSWRAYEQGMTDAVPKKPRPTWLAMTDATNTQERLRLEADPDERGERQEIPRRASPPAAVSHPSQLDTRPNSPPRRAKKKPNRAPRSEYRNVDVPVPLEGANCATLPSELVDKYFNVDVRRQAAAAQVAKLVCDHCPIIETCLSRALNGSNVRKSGVIAGMGARELERGRRWLRYEQGTAKTVPTSPRPSWLPQSQASTQFQVPSVELEQGIQ